MTLAEPLVFNPLDPAFRADPYPVYRRLLREAPVFETPFGVPAFSRFDDCLAILRDHRHFSSDDRKSPMYGQNMASARDVLGAWRRCRRTTGRSCSWTHRITRGCGGW